MITSPKSLTLTVLGAGVMGTSIAAMALGEGMSVRLIDVDGSTLDRARLQVEQQLRHAQLLSVLPAGQSPGALHTDTAIAAAAGSSAVIEAITERFSLKRDILAEVSEFVAPETPLISNTSGIPIDDLAEGLPRPGDLLGTHFMNPAYLIKTVEVVRGPRTNEAVMTITQGLLSALRRRPVVVRDAPGFVTTRLLHPMINDAARLIDEGIATAESVDTLMQGCLGHPMGPLRTADLIGLDNLVDSLERLYERTDEQRFQPCDLLLRKVAQGNLGRKSGKGFYEYGKVLS